MATSQFQIKGLPELSKRLESIKYDAQYKGGRFALRKAAQVIRDAAKNNARQVDDSATGRSIAENVAERWNGRLYKKTGNLGFRVGILKGAKLPPKGEKPDLAAGAATPHWRLLEFGTEKMAARPFFARAATENIDRVTSVFVTEFNKAIDRAIKKGVA